MGLAALLVLGPHAVVEVVGGVVAAPQDPVVGRPSVVVELVGGIADAFASRPADRGQLLARQRLGHQHMVVDRDHVPPWAPERSRVGVRGHDDAVGADRAGRGAHHELEALGLDLGHGAVLVDDNAERLGDRTQPPSQTCGIDQRVAAAPQQPTDVGGRVDQRPHTATVQQRDVVTVSLEHLDVGGQLVVLPRRGRDVECGDAEEVDGLDEPVAHEGVLDACEVLRAEPFEGGDLVGPVADAVEQTVCQRCRAESAIARAGAEADGLGLEHDDAPTGLFLGRLDGGPQAGEPGTDDDQIGGDRVAQRRRRFGGVGDVAPEHPGCSAVECLPGPGGGGHVSCRPGCWRCR